MSGDGDRLIPQKQQIRNLINRFENPKACEGHTKDFSRNAPKFAAHDSKVSSQIKEARIKLEKIFSATEFKQEFRNRPDKPERSFGLKNRTEYPLRSACSSVKILYSQGRSNSNLDQPQEIIQKEISPKISIQNEIVVKFPKKAIFQDKNSTSLLAENWSELFAPSNTVIQLKIPTFSFIYSVPTYYMFKQYLSAAGSGLVLLALFPYSSENNGWIEIRLKIMDKMAAKYPDVSLLFAFIFPEAFARTTHMNWPVLLFYKNENVIHEEIWEEPLLHKKSGNLDCLISKLNVFN